jgi:hypothetical protein
MLRKDSAELRFHSLGKNVMAPSDNDKQGTDF